MVEENIDFREIDNEETAKMDGFCRNECGCSMNCAMQFSAKHYLLTCSNPQQMHRNELDIALMGPVMPFIVCSQAPQNSTEHGHYSMHENIVVSAKHKGVSI